VNFVRRRIFPQSNPVEIVTLTVPFLLEFYCPAEGISLNHICQLRHDLDIYKGSSSRSEVILHYQDASYAIDYACPNCREFRTILIRVAYLERTVIKLSEFPQVAEPLPSHLIDLAGFDSDTLLKGYEAEQRGFGLGAFAYYRRVVENSWRRFLSEAKTVALVENSDVETIKAIDDAIGQDRFENAIHSVKELIPKSLFINNKNPFLLLYGVTSAYLHDKPDEEWLKKFELCSRNLSSEST
jgi:hypothetical protein